MDSFITLIIFFILIGLVERLLKGKSQRRDTGDAGETAGGGELRGRRPRSELERIILEQIGIDVEPPPGAETRPGSMEGAAHPSLEGEAAPTSRPPATPGRTSPPQVVLPRGRTRGAPEERVPGHRSDERERQRRQVARRDEVERRRRRTQRPARRPPIEEEPQVPEVVSLEEIGMRERGEAASLERPRQPADHDRFHRRYAVPKPVASHDDFHRRYVVPPRHRPARERRARLPVEPGWSEVERAIVWSEVIGPPKGLID